MKVATDAVQLFGASGISNEYPINRYFRDAKVLQIIEGTNQIQRNIIARNMIKEADEGCAADRKPRASRPHFALHQQEAFLLRDRSEARRVGNEGGSTWRTRW